MLFQTCWRPSFHFRVSFFWLWFSIDFELFAQECRLINHMTVNGVWVRVCSIESRLVFRRATWMQNSSSFSIELRLEKVQNECFWTFRTLKPFWGGQVWETGNGKSGNKKTSVFAALRTSLKQVDKSRFGDILKVREKHQRQKVVWKFRNKTLHALNRSPVVQ